MRLPKILVLTIDDSLSAQVVEHPEEAACALGRWGALPAAIAPQNKKQVLKSRLRIFHFFMFSKVCVCLLENIEGAHQLKSLKQEPI